jgi:hypothetical protein
MTKINSLKLALVAGGFVTVSMLATSLASHHFTTDGFSFISSAQAAEDGTSGKKKSGKAQGGSTGDHGTVKGGKGKKDVMMKGQGGPGTDSDSDRPIWAGVKGGKAGAGGKPAGGGTKKGDLYGDLYIILRDADGKPILNAAGFVQPVAADGSLVPLDAEGAPLDSTLVQSVEFSRLSVSRAPSKVLTKSLTEALSKITAGTAITLDAAGRVVIDGTAIDSPLENLALYKAIMTKTLPADVASKLPASLAASSLLAAAADKTSTLNVDIVVYLNSFLGINTVTDGKVTAYYDFTTDYNREATYKNVTATVLVPQGDGVTYVATTVNVYDTVFSGSTWVDPTPSDAGADDFAAAANDALRVIQYIHDNAVR